MQLHLLILTSLGALALADNINCFSATPGRQGCEASFPAGLLGNCPGGYDEESYDAPGQSPGTYCVRGCTDDESNGCNQDHCKDYSKNCLQGQPVACGLAVRACKGVVDDQVCAKAFSYSKCIYTDRCQPSNLRCCPATEEQESYTLVISNLVKSAGKVKLEKSTCGSNDSSSINAAQQAYQKGGKTRTLKPGRGKACGNSYKGSVFNFTTTDPAALDAVNANNKAICEGLGAVFDSGASNQTSQGSA